MKRKSLSEAETRQLIDQQLRLAGWQADTASLRHSRGTRPEKGTDKAIAEWPTETGPVDYALFSGLELLGLVEAKKRARDVVSDLGQAKRYARGVRLDGDGSFAGGPWGDLRVPFLFATNGRAYLKQLQHKSGIWFLDARRPTVSPRPVQAWYSPPGLQALLKQDLDAAAERLREEPTDYLGLRDYQLSAIQKVEEALAADRREALLAMATGTGKTKTAGDTWPLRVRVRRLPDFEDEKGEKRGGGRNRPGSPQPARQHPSTVPNLCHLRNLRITQKGLPHDRLPRREDGPFPPSEARHLASRRPQGTGVGW